MKIELKVDYSKATKLFAQVTGDKARDAIAKALTDAAFEARKTIQANMDTSFDGVTPYIKRSIQVDKATPDKMVATVEPKYMGGKGVDPQNILWASIYGGRRKHKASENAFRLAGILPRGYSIVPGGACPVDRYGNIRGSFMIQLITYFQAAGEQGYKANMTIKRKAKLAKEGRTANGYKTINGVIYFISQGELPGGKGVHDQANRTIHLHPGIWSKTGIHGSDVKPIIMFVKEPTYKTRLDFYVKPAIAGMEKFNPRLRYHLRTVIESMQ